MAWNTQITLHSVPVDDGNYPWFDDNAAMVGWMNGQQTASWNNLKVAREGSYKVRIPAPAESVYTANYVGFINRDLGNQRFFGRITNVLYINPECTEITFDTDWLLSGMGLFTLGECYVEREHELNDWAKHASNTNNIADEGIDPGEWVYVAEQPIADTIATEIVLVAASSPEGNVTNGQKIDRVYTGGYYLTSTVPGPINDALQRYAEEGNLEAVQAVMQVPTMCVTSVQSEVSIGRPTNADGYTPENAKVLQYPYTVCEVTSADGNIGIYGFEFGEYSSLTFRTVGAGGFTSPCIMCYPRGYNGQSENYDAGVTFSSFPRCAAAGNAYQNWVTQNSAGIAAKLTGAVVGAGITIATAGTAAPVAVGAGLAAASAIGSVATSAHQKSLSPANIISQAGGDALNVSIGRPGIVIRVKTPRADQAERIDSYFKAFGYFQGKVKVPNVNTRPIHNYVKTVGATILSPTIPQIGVNEIQRRLDSGIQFWRNGANWGNYSLDNRG